MDARLYNWIYMYNVVCGIQRNTSIVRLQKISDAEFSDQRSQQISARKRGTNLYMYNENGKFSKTTLKLLL